MKVKQFVMLLFIVTISYSSSAQINEAFNYQAVFRDNRGNPLINVSKPLKVDIVQNNQVVYSEQHSGVKTDSFGLVAIKIGLGIQLTIGTPPILSNFSKIKWGYLPTNLRISELQTGILLSESPILAAPIALYAVQSGSTTDSSWSKLNDNLYRTTGNVGIGVNNPTTKLEVEGTIKTKGLIVQGSDFVLGNNDGRSVGNVPFQRALVHDVGDKLKINFGNDFEGGVQIDGTVTTQNQINTGYIATRILIVEGADLALGTNDGRSVGNIPYQRALVHDVDDVLSINYERDFEGGVRIHGNTNITGTLATQCIEIRGGCDIVEYRQSKDKPQAGEVVICDPENANQVLRATKAYDKKVIGVVSGAGGINSGMSLSQAGKFGGDVPVSMLGTVKVKVVGKVEAGDLLTTSDKAGYAMTAKNRKRSFGTVIGKAITAPDRDGLVTMIIQPR